MKTADLLSVQSPNQLIAMLRATATKYREDFAKSAKPGESAGDSIRRNFRRQYGRRLASRWFD